MKFSIVFKTSKLLFKKYFPLCLAMRITKFVDQSYYQVSVENPMWSKILQDLNSLSLSLSLSLYIYIYTYIYIYIYSFFSKLWSIQYCCIDAPCGIWPSAWRESLTAIVQECCDLYGTSPGGRNPQSSSCTDTWHSSLKPSKLDEQNMRDTAGEIRAGLISDIFLWTPHTDEQV